MKFQFNPPLQKLRRARKYIYLINDITNTLLKKERVGAEEKVRKLRLALIIVSIILLISLILNIYFILT